MQAQLNELLQHPSIWGAHDRQAVGESIASGFPELDRELPGGGWPVGALTEILFPQPGIGELRLLAPALARLSQAQRWLAWIAPPYIPYAPALAAHGIDLSRVMVVHPRDEHAAALWAIEQALRAGTCAAVLAWVKRADERSLRRLQLAAEAGNTVGILFRSQYSVVQTSPAALRLKLAPTDRGLEIDILKRRGAWPRAGITLDLWQRHGQCSQGKDASLRCAR